MFKQLKIEELEHRADIEPRYLRDDQISALRNNFEGHIPLEQRKSYEEIEHVVSEKFIGMFSSFITEEQKKYMRGSRIIMVDHKEMDTFVKGIEEYTKDQDHSRAALDGMIYRGYGLASDEAQSEREKILPYNKEDEKGDRGVQTWHGRIPIVPIFSTFETTYPDKTLLMNEATFAAGDYPMSRYLEPFVITNRWGAMALHEKIHGVQDYDIPLPILEIAAHAYEQEVFQKNGWEVRKMPAFNEAIRIWKTLQEKMGDDLYRYIFGNLPLARKKEIDVELQNIFTSEYIQEIFPQVIWKTEKIETFPS